MYTASMLLLALALVCLNGLFVAAEFSFVKVRKTQIELLADSGDGRAKSALFGVTHLDAYLSVCQLGITLSSLGLGWLGEPAVASVLRPALAFFSIGNPALVTSLSIAIGFCIITLMHVVFGELAPKSIAIQKAEDTALLLARPMRFFYVICLPLVTVMNGVSNAFLRLVGMHSASESEESHSPEELRMLILNSSERGNLDKDEGRMLDNIFSFYHKTAKDIMVHRLDAMAFDVDTKVADLLKAAHESGHTRFPVYEENRDNIIGFVHLRDAARQFDSENMRGMVREPFYAHETLRLDKMLQRMQETRQQFCVVLDEYGVWQGIVTMEDIVEAIVGNIQDEFDNEEQDVTDEGRGVWSVSPDMSLDELAEYMHLDCKGDDVHLYKIIAAHFMERLERIPEQGDAIEMCGKRLIVSRMEGNRIRRVRIEDAPEKTDGTEK
ncbi:hemolysin family protein [Desulfovibrio sp. OttesenSCG-928-M14]|nr:hemolysin family protein [Desulfovibrio sp. OttesenSCG-928-M14]